jgi:hypothetical protein
MISERGQRIHRKEDKPIKTEALDFSEINPNLRQFVQEVWSSRYDVPCDLVDAIRKDLARNLAQIIMPTDNFPNPSEDYEQQGKRVKKALQDFKTRYDPNLVLELEERVKRSTSYVD